MRIVKRTLLLGVLLLLPGLVIRAQPSPVITPEPSTHAAPAAPHHHAAPKPRHAEDAVTPAFRVPADRQAAFLERGKDKKIQLVFLGDSITDFWSTTGRPVWDKYYAGYDAADFAVQGETTSHTLKHIEGGILDGLSPRVVVILIGTNNIGRYPDEKPEWAAAGVAKIVQTVHGKVPGAKIILLALFPRDDKEKSLRSRVAAVNAIISKETLGPEVHYLDIGARFLDSQGNLPPEIFPDGLHPTEKGYQIWAEAMQPVLDPLMK